MMAFVWCRRLRSSEKTTLINKCSDNDSAIVVITVGWDGKSASRSAARNWYSSAAV